jgi:hypothetical protein
VIYVYTSILNGWDNLRPPAVWDVPGVRFICFTNVPNLPNVHPWEFRPIYPAGETCRTARVPKILPHLMLPDDAEYSIYHDGNLRLSKNPIAMIATFLDSHNWAAHKHPCRTCIYQEADVILNHESMEGWRAQNPDRAPRIAEEVDRYRTGKFPQQAGLWANGMIIRRHTDSVATLNERWWRLYSAGGERDQLSFPVARRAENLEINTINEPISESSQVGFFFHAAWKDKPSSREFHPERNRIRGSLERLQALTGSDGGVKYPVY